MYSNLSDLPAYKTFACRLKRPPAFPLRTRNGGSCLTNLRPKRRNCWPPRKSWISTEQDFSGSDRRTPESSSFAELTWNMTVRIVVAAVH